jgi:hypothetical protein
VILVDTHAHLYPCHDLDRFLTAARRNFEQISARVAPARDRCTYILCLTERSTEDAFANLLAARLRPRRQDRKSVV